MKKTILIFSLSLAMSIFSSLVFAGPNECKTNQCDAHQFALLPTGDVFQPFIADPKEPSFSMSLQRYIPHDQPSTYVVQTGLGETIGLIRWPSSHHDRTGQTSLMAGVFAQFDSGAPSRDLLNADYIFGVTQDYRFGKNSIRGRIWHQSSHLGDEPIIKDAEIRNNRINHSFSNVGLFYSREINLWRVYAGGTYDFTNKAEKSHPKRAQLGLEYQGRKADWGGSFIFGVDIKGSSSRDWKRNISIKSGLDLIDCFSLQRKLRIMLEFYHGDYPYSQYFEREYRSFGIGIYVDL